jgi:hypothetical protein
VKVFRKSCGPPTRSVGLTERSVGLLIGRTYLSGTAVSLVSGDPGYTCLTVPNVNLSTRFKNSWNDFELSHWHVGPSIDLRLLHTETDFGTFKDRWDLLGSSCPICAHKFQPSSPLILPVPVRVSPPPLPPPYRRWARLGRITGSQHAPLDKSRTHR